MFAAHSDSAIPNPPPGHPVIASQRRSNPSDAADSDIGLPRRCAPRNDGRTGTSGAKRRTMGLTLIELIIFIVVMSVGLMGILAVYNTIVQRSSDPLISKQALSAAESLLMEIEQQPFTWCDPQDDNVTTATHGGIGADGCATTSQSALGPSPSTETRGSPSDPFDNVGDYHGYSGTASDILGVSSPELARYTVSVVITPAGGTAPFTGFPAGAVLRIEVTVKGGAEDVTLVGYRTRHSPNAAG
jgi:MSHA pilin protein MshD